MEANRPGLFYSSQWQNSFKRLDRYFTYISPTSINTEPTERSTPKVLLITDMEWNDNGILLHMVEGFQTFSDLWCDGLTSLLSDWHFSWVIALALSITPVRQLKCITKRKTRHVWRVIFSPVFLKCLSDKIINSCFCILFAIERKYHFLEQWL